MRHFYKSHLKRKPVLVSTSHRTNISSSKGGSFVLAK